MTKRRNGLLKALSIIYAIALIACFYPIGGVYAETDCPWARIVKDNVNLYTDESLERVMFTL